MSTPGRGGVIVRGQLMHGYIQRSRTRLLVSPCGIFGSVFSNWAMVFGESRDGGTTADDVQQDSVVRQATVSAINTISRFMTGTRAPHKMAKLVYR
ncbi:hypothetical protein LSAT2_005984 [Lamellibrachia satsuma]|nr:hypothetical protein LSAT2_005984 [Lamellibrachia satsuma]